MTKPFLLKSLAFIFLLLNSLICFSQTLPSSVIYHKLLQLKETKRVLYVAAHPDDENTQLIAALGNGEHVQVAYLSLTRGDGGQNLIGKELGIELGQIRTQELLQARATDGGRQFFTRAMDFGYSKDPEETLQNWDKQKVLSDVVWVIRNFRPDIIITRFNTEPGGNHGHHTTSAILAEEAFDLAADATSFPEQLKFVDTWQSKRIFWNSYNFGGEFKSDKSEQYAMFPVGEFNSLLGTTYSQIAANSRTMHKSQGFGATARIGAADDNLQFIKGEAFQTSAFEGIPDRWKEIEGGMELASLIQSAIDKFDFKDPIVNLKSLTQIRTKLVSLNSNSSWVNEKIKKLDLVIFELLGLKMEFVTNQELGYSGENIKANLIVNNPSVVLINDISFHLFNNSFSAKKKVASNNEPVLIPVEFQIAEDLLISQPYWLVNPVVDAIYDVKDQQMIGKPFNDMKVGGELSFTINGQEFRTQVPLEYKYNDQVDGETKQPFTIVPEIDLEVSDENVFLISDLNPVVTVTVNFNGEVKEGELTFKNLMSSEFQIMGIEENLNQKKRLYRVSFKLDKNEKREVIAQFKTADSKIFDQVTHRITYKHIPNLTYFSPASMNLIQEDWKVSGAKIGYIMGAGDDVPAVLSSLGYQVSEISDYSLANLSQYKSIVVGIRAYNTNAALAANQQNLMTYVENGGTVVVQYNVSRPLLTDKLGPYPFSIGRDRVTVEDSPFTADWDHPILAGPNEINVADFDDWIQERGLYFVSTFAPEYSTPLTFQDPNEDPLNNSLIYAKYGKGTYIYTGISFFRELPAGVPGATKLFINLIEQ
ncbi:LmbE family N-acetylglucosaminyl deacetylase [Algoriphagus ratkowskyi]|uniref:LmbE family N-acetylglucosaminyl deacetylase n=1 Tax=Algoriphagus ratkowskyi TaxID=57028 RepID=A0A2W7QZ01_9BACT|nr:PIG-L family deacetylase [Algoriphagus ratkowskyi]PZX51270.1 LmbE family N-acetylglucosaminyl deacetylase [Algoriphagus ratkowskyi]TXD75938.1 PIG-L family deacetylase [Algoriphagus ratkowskyi]